jgi:hypothetical protein
VKDEAALKAKKFPPHFALKVIRGDIALHFQKWVRGETPDIESHQSYLIQPGEKGEKPGPSLGIIRVTSCVLVDIDDISQDDAQAAGYADKWALRKRFEGILNDGKELPKHTCLWRIEWKVIQRADGKPIPRTEAERKADAERAAEIEKAEAA